MIINSTGSLTIYSLKTIDRGVYICEVSNEIGQARQQYQIDVYGKNFVLYLNLSNFTFLEPPSLIKNSIEIEINANISNPILLPCLVNGYPPPTIAWFRQNNPINRKNIK